MVGAGEGGGPLGDWEAAVEDADGSLDLEVRRLSLKRRLGVEVLGRDAGNYLLPDCWKSGEVLHRVLAAVFEGFCGALLG